MVSLIVLGSLGFSFSSFAENATVYYPDNSPVVSSSNNIAQTKTRAEVKNELKQAQKSGEIQTLNQTVFVGH